MTTNNKFMKLFDEGSRVRTFCYTCDGTFVCNNIECKFYKRFNVFNQVSAKRASKDRGTCTSCVSTLEKLTCQGRKTVSYQIKNEGEETKVFIHHQGHHSCLAKFCIQENTKREIESYFDQNPNTPPSLAWYNMLSKTIRDGASENEIKQLLVAQIDDWTFSNLKTVSERKIMPFSTTIEAINQVKESFVQNDSCKNYRIVLDIITDSAICTFCNKLYTQINENDAPLPKQCICLSSELVNTGMFVYVSCESSFKRMLEMDKDKPLYGQSCSLDHQPGRVKDYTTFEGILYDPDMQSIVTLFTFHMMGETQFHVASALAWNNVKLRSYSDDSVGFMPHGFVTDEAGGLLAGLSRIYPGIPISSDNFHFKQNAYQILSHDIGDSNDMIRLLRFCYALQNTTSPFIYSKILFAFKEWTKASVSREKRVLPYLEWWDARRLRWATAFQNWDVEKHSLSEIGNSMVSRKGLMKNEPLHECVKFEICKYYRYHVKQEAYINGSFKRGKGPTRKALMARKVEEFNERLKIPVTKESCRSLIVDIFNDIGLPAEDMIDCDDAIFNVGKNPLDYLSQEIKDKAESVIDPNSSHNFKAWKFELEPKRKAKKAGRPKNSKKPKLSWKDPIVSSDEETENLVEMPDDDDIENIDPNTLNAPKLHGKYTTFPSQWRWIQRKIEDMEATYTMTEVSSLVYKIIKIGSEPERLVKFNDNITSCTCEDFVKKQQNVTGCKIMTYNCKHIIFTMSKLGVAKDDLLLRRHHLSDDDVLKLSEYASKWKPPSPDSHPKTPLSLSTQNLYFNDIQEGRRRMKEEKCAWTVSYYSRHSKKGGRSHQCSTINGDIHYIQNNQLCLGVNLNTMFKPRQSNAYLLKKEKRYFCAKNDCIKFPKRSFTNLAFSNYELPKTDDILFDTEISEEDRLTVKNLFSL